MSKVVGKRYTYKFDLSSLMQASHQRNEQTTTIRDLLSSFVFHLPDNAGIKVPSHAKADITASNCLAARSNHYYSHLQFSMSYNT